MKLLMTCDDVFEALTHCRQSFGAELREEDQAVKQHLRACQECGRLAKRLGPAVDRLQEEAAWMDEGDSLPVATRILDRLSAQQEKLRPGRTFQHYLAISGQTWTQLAAAAAILVALSALLWAAAPQRPGGGQEQALLSFPTPSAAGRQPDAHGLLHLASLRLQVTCRTPKAESQDAAAVFECCTRCHRSGDPLPTARLVAFSQQSCVACHKS